MKISQLFTHTLREAPKDEVSVNAQLLERAGFVKKFMAGVYVYLPLGWRVIENIKRIIKEEMDAIGGQELQFSSSQPKELWEKTGRWKLLGKEEKIMHQFQDHWGHEMGLASTHEEPITEVAKNYIHSYKDLPKAVYQFQKKFRDEMRPKSGLVRLREFLMKDLYSFHATEADLSRYYEEVKNSYTKVFKRCGLEALVIEASGGVFTENVSHEFQVLSPYGEDKIIYCAKCHWAQNREIAKVSENDACPKCQGPLSPATGVEVGNIFNNGTKYSKDLGLLYKDAQGAMQLVWMASYGIGLDRLMGTIVDVHHDEKGIIWTEEVAPFRAHLVAVGPESEMHAHKTYEAFMKEGVDVLYDDREDVSAGEKFAVADLIGMPYRIVVSPATLKEGKVEFKRRTEQEAHLMTLEKAIKECKS